MIGAKLGHFLDKPLEPLAKRIPFHPNTISFAGFIVTFTAAFLMTRNLAAGGALLLVGSAFDLLDGVVARTHGKATSFGAFLDSTLDRYCDSVLFLSIAWVFIDRGEPLNAIITAGTLAGALLVSYVRARAEAIGADCRVGIMERPERLVVLAFGCLTGWIVPAVYALFLLSHITVVERIIHVYRQQRH